MDVLKQKQALPKQEENGEIVSLPPPTRESSSSSRSRNQEANSISKTAKGGKRRSKRSRKQSAATNDTPVEEEDDEDDDDSGYESPVELPGAQRVPGSGSAVSSANDAPLVVASSQQQNATTEIDGSSNGDNDGSQDIPVLQAYIKGETRTRKTKQAPVVVGVAEDTSRQRKLLPIVVIVLVLIAITTTAVILIVRASNKSSEDKSVAFPTFAPTTGTPLDTMAVLKPFFTSDETDISSNSLDPLGRAYYWITEEDPSAMAFDPSTPEWKLVQRFALAVLYMTTNGPQWTNQINFLSQADECEWKDETFYINQDITDFYNERYENDTSVTGRVVLDEDASDVSFLINEQQTYLYGWDPIEILSRNYKVTNTTRTIVGVRNCDSLGRITAINIPGNSLNGTLPNILSKLESLENIEFLGNLLQGTLPASLGELSNLKSLNLAFNLFSGTLPVEYSSMLFLERLLLDVNELTGTLPASYSELTNLDGLLLSRNLLSGTLPQEYSRMTNLKRVALNGNRLSGSLPSAYASWAKVESIYLQVNQLNGTLPEEYSEWKTLRDLNLFDNSLQGSLPKIYSSLTSLRQVIFGSNPLTGPLPSEYANWESIKIFHVSLTEVSGTLPSEYAKWPSIEEVYFESNALSGTLPSEYASWKDLQQAQFGDNSLSGTLPTDYSAWVNVREVDFRYTRVGGTLPTEYGSWLSIQQARFFEVALSGTLPTEFSKWTKLQSAFFSRTNLSGPLPSEYASWTKLENAMFAQNRLSGTLPSEYSDWRSIQFAFFSSNSLSGTLPAEFSKWTDLRFLLLSFNDLSGTLPSDYSSWKRLGTAEITFNSISGTLPPEYASWSVLKKAAFSSNQLVGTLPRDYSTWTLLNELHLGFNSISGTLPTEFATLTSLEKFDFSYCDLSGSLPTEYSAWIQLRSLEMQGNNLSGTLPSQYSSWKLLNGLELNSNSISGTLPSAYAAWTVVQEVDLKSNDLSGTLPAELSAWSIIRSAAFDYNSISGTLPSEYSTWTDLEAMEFRSNALSGRLPESYSKLTAITSIDVANNNMHGTIPESYPFSVLYSGNVRIDLEPSLDCENAIPVSMDDIAFIGGNAPTKSLVYDSTLSCDTTLNLEGVWYSFEGKGGNVAMEFLCDESELSVSPELDIRLFQGANCDELICIDFTSAICDNSQFSIDWFADSDTLYSMQVSERTINVSSASSFRLRIVPDFSPKNDACEDALSLVFNETGQIVTGDTSFANLDFASGATSPGLWYNIMADDVAMIANTCREGTDFDTVLTVYRGNCDALESVDTNDDFCDTQSQVSWFAEEGVEYVIFVAGFESLFGLETGGFTLSIEEGVPALQTDAPTDPTGDFEPIPSVPTEPTSSPPENEACATAISLIYNGTAQSVTGDTSLANIDVASGVASPGLWYIFIGDGNSIIASTCSEGTSFDTVLTVYQGSCDALEVVDTNDDFCDTQSQVSWFGEDGVEYFLFVTGFSFLFLQETGVFELLLFDGAP